VSNKPIPLIRVTCQNCGARCLLPKSIDRTKVYRCPKCKTAIVSPYLQPQRDLESRLTATVDFLKKREAIVVGIFLVFVFLVHLFVIPMWGFPLSDEHYYVTEARSIITQHQITHPEHPELGKLFIASGFVVFGYNNVGGRMASALFAVFLVAVFYFICRELVGVGAASFATILFAFESLNFVQSQLAMLDVFSVTFMLLAFLLYIKNRHVLSGLSIALSGLCKMPGLLGILPILAYWFLSKRRQPLKNVIFLSISAVLGFIIMMMVFDLAATHAWADPFTRISTMIHKGSALTVSKLTTPEAQMVSFPWEWVLSPIGHLNFKQVGAATFISPTVWVLIIPSMCYMLYDYFRNKTDVSLFALLWFGSTYLLWIPLQLLTDRQTYLYYFYPSIGAVCLAISYATSRIWSMTSQQRCARYRFTLLVVVGGYVILHLLVFLVLAIWAPNQVSMKPLIP